MLSLSFGDKRIEEGKSYDPSLFLKKSSIFINNTKNRMHTLIMYDTSAPDPDFDINSPYLHLLVTNIKNGILSSGDVLAEYLRPRPHVGKHRYVLELYEQKEVVKEIIKKRDKFDILGDNNYMRGYPWRNNLTLAKRIVFYINPLIDMSNDKNWTHNPISEREQKFCRCVLHVAGKQSEKCLREKRWGETIDGKVCYNPYPVCAKSTRTSSRVCGEHYEWQNIPDNELVSYARIKNLNEPTPYNRKSMLQNVYNWKTNYNKK